MEDKRNLHLKVQEMIDCNATTNPLEEMSKIGEEPDAEQAAVKWLALAALHGLGAGAKKIKLKIGPGGQVAVEAKYREARLPAPSPELAQGIMAAMRAITHLEGAKGEEPLALGVRNDSIELEVKLKDKDGAQELSLKFPE